MVFKASVFFFFLQTYPASGLSESMAIIGQYQEYIRARMQLHTYVGAENTFSSKMYEHHRFDQYQPSCYFFLHTDMHSPLDSIPHIFGRMHAPVHRRTCFQHICTHTRSHAPSIPQQTFCCFLCLSLLVVISL